MRAVALALALAASAAHGQTGAVAGRVTDAETGEPLAGASVAVSAQRGAAADADGQFRIDGLAAGPYQVRAQRLGYAPLDTAVVVRAGETIRLDLRLALAVRAEVVVQARRSATATRADAPVLLVPQAVSVLPPAVLAAQDARDLGDALRNVPGATTTARGEPVRAPVLRGFEADQTGGGVRRNGVEVPALADGLRANVARVEVLRGPASVLYGRLEPGGVVNYITDVPRAERHVELAASGGTLGSGGLAVDAGGPVRGVLAGRVNAEAAREGSARDAVATTSLLFAPALRWQRAGLTLDADVEATSTEAVLDPGLAVVAGRDRPVGAAADDTALGPFHGEPDAHVRWRSLGAFAAADVALGPRASLRATASLTRYGLVRDLVRLDSLVQRDRQRAIARSLRREDLGFTYLKAGAFLNAGAQTGAVRHALTVGVEGIQAWAQAEGTAPLADDGAGGFSFADVDPVALDDPRPTGLPADRDLVRYLDARVRGLDLGVFAQDRATVPLGRARLHAVVSGRLSYVGAEADIVALADTPDAPAGVSTRRFDVVAFTPAAGLVAELRPGLALYLSGGTSFNPSVERVDRTGEPFRPTRGVQAEGGAKAEVWDGRLAGSAAAFWIRKDDALTQGPDGFFVQTGRQRSRGLELEARGEPVAGLSMLANYAFLDAVVVADAVLVPGTRLPYAPRHSGGVWAEGTRGPWTLRAGVWARGPRRASTTSTQELPADAVVDLGAAVRLAGGLALRIDVRNALDARGYAAATERGGLDRDRLWAAWPTPAREVRLGVVVRR